MNLNKIGEKLNTKRGPLKTMLEIFWATLYVKVDTMLLLHHIKQEGSEGGRLTSGTQCQQNIWVLIQIFGKSDDFFL